MNTDIEVVTKALTDFDLVAAGLEQLNKNYKGMLFDVETPNGMAVAKAARAALRNPRYEIERIRKEAKAPLLAIGKKLDSEAARITAEILKLEEPIDQQIKNEEQRKERERLAKVEAEQKRIAAILARIEAIRLLPSRAIGKTSAEVKRLLDEAAAIIIDNDFAEYAPQANTALQTTILALQGAHAERLNHEAEQARIVAERAELERLREEQAKRDQAERARIAAEEAAAKAARDAETAAQAEALRVQRVELERHAQQLRATQEAEAARLAEVRATLEREQAEAKRKADEAEAKRLAEEAAERTRKEDALRAAKKAKYPGDAAILDALAKHFDVSEQVVRGWLTQLKAAA